MIPEFSVESTLLTLMFLIGMLVGGVIGFVVMSYQQSRLDKQRRDYSEY